MKLQRSRYTCGILAVVNAARALGVKVSERSVRAHSGTTKKDGTTEHGIKNALERLGFTPEDLRAPKDEAHEALLHHLREGAAVILSVEEGRHWATAIGAIGVRIVTFDSWNAAWNRKECGVDVINAKQLLRWWTPDRDGLRYGIVVRRDE
jgi:ABC-type bacteriocin/lantibiotic exporter with double-glycine peptidase domain